MNYKKKKKKDELRKFTGSKGLAGMSRASHEGRSKKLIEKQKKTSKENKRQKVQAAKKKTKKPHMPPFWLVWLCSATKSIFSQLGYVISKLFHVRHLSSYKDNNNNNKINPSKARTVTSELINTM